MQYLWEKNNFLGNRFFWTVLQKFHDLLSLWVFGSQSPCDSDRNRKNPWESWISSLLVSTFGVAKVSDA